jgi:hypothetical protein
VLIETSKPSEHKILGLDKNDLEKLEGEVVDFFTEN